MTKKKNLAIAKLDNPLSVESLQKEGIDTKISSKDLVDLIVSSKYDELLATAQALKEESSTIISELNVLIFDECVSPHIDCCIKAELERIKLDSKKVEVSNRRITPKDGILTTKYNQIEIAIYSRKFEAKLSPYGSVKSGDVYSCMASVRINVSPMIPIYSSNVVVPDFFLTKEMMAKRDYLLKRLYDVSSRIELFYKSLPKGGIVDKVEMSTEIKNLMTKEALHQIPDLKKALAEKFNIKF